MYGNQYGTGCLTLTDPVCEPCAIKEKGRIRGVAFIKVGTVFSDISDPAEWATNIGNGTVKVLPKTSGQYDGPTEKFGEGFGDADKEYETSEHKGKFMDPNYAVNAAFYNQLRKVGYKEWKMAFCSDHYIHLTDVPVTCQPKAPIKNDKTANIIWEVDFSFIQEDHPVPELKPAGVFVCD